MVNVLGFDIGGANTKAAYLTVRNGIVTNAQITVEYFPIWREHQSLTNVLLRIKERLGATKLDGLAVTMTAELSDAFQTKREGVRRILDCVKQAFPEATIQVLGSDAKLIPFSLAFEEPLSVAAANWAATGWLVSQHINDCVVVDVGSTSTSIIPIVNGKVAACGKNDLEKLICGELVYMGSLRTNIAAIVHSIPLKNGVAHVASELFALSGDLHLILGNISEKEYTSETADGRGKTVEEAMARLTRVVCADTEMLTRQEIVDMAKYVHHKQVEQIAEGLSKVYLNVQAHASGRVPIVATGLGKDFLARKAAQIINADAIVDLDELLEAKAVLATPAFGVALMAARMLEGEYLK